MSKLGDMIDATQTGRLKIYPQKLLPIADISEEIREVSYGYAYEYTLGAKLEVVQVIRLPKEIARAKDTARRYICEAIFGEFRPLILDIEKAIGELDLEAARNLLRQLCNEMEFNR